MATAVQQRLLNLGAEIAATPPDHSVLTQTSLPTSKPPEGLLIWERQQGRAKLRVEAGSVMIRKPASMFILAFLGSKAGHRGRGGHTLVGAIGEDHLDERKQPARGAP